MRRLLVVLLVTGLVLAPAAVAKGPHAVLAGPKSALPGAPWEAMVDLNEFPDAPQPSLIATRGPRRVSTLGSKLPGRTDRFRLRMVFPTAGRWKLTLAAGERRLAFPDIRVGRGEGPAEDGGGAGPWLLPIAGVILAGAGVAALSLRGSR